MENENKPVSRKRFVIWGVGVLSVFTAARYFFRSGPKQNTTTVKMLTQDGRLVEVEVSKLSSKRKKIKDADVHTWVHRKSSL
jgi:intracellular sulfur oxidation DsrE/DsrF family protein